MIKANFGDRIDGWIHTLFPFLFRRPLHPDALTLAGVAVSTTAAVAFAQGSLRAGATLLLAGGFFDLVDGVVARDQNRSTSFGAFLDSTMDRLVDMLLLFGIVIYFADSGRTGMMVLTGWVMAMSILTSYAKARAELVVPTLEGGLLERGERIGLLGIGGLFGILEPVLAILALGTTITVAQRFRSAHRAMAELDADRAASSEAGLRSLETPAGASDSGSRDPGANEVAASSGAQLGG